MKNRNTPHFLIYSNEEEARETKAIHTVQLMFHEKNGVHKSPEGTQ